MITAESRRNVPDWKDPERLDQQFVRFKAEIWKVS